MKASILAALAGSCLALLTWTGLRASLQPPESWLWIYVRSGCGPSEQAIEDARAAPSDASIAVIPLDSDSADLACPVTLARLVRLRPWLAFFPERWACDGLRAHAVSQYTGLGVRDEATPIYQLADHISLGWSKERRAAVLRGAADEVFE